MWWFRTTSPPSAVPRRSGTSRLEWGVALMGAAILSGMIAYMTFEGLSGSGGPALVELKAGAVTSAPQGFVLEFKARNAGFSTAAEVKVIATLLDGERVVEEREATLDYLPERSERAGGFFFRNDPRRYQVELASEGYAAP